MTYSTINKPTALKIIDEVNAILRKYGAENNLELVPGRGRYSESDVTLNMTMKIAGEKSFAEKATDSHTKSYMMAYGLTDEPRNGKKLIEIKTRSCKYPVIYKDLNDGKRYKTSLNEAKRLFAA